jgi:hypothetical protein
MAAVRAALEDARLEVESPQETFLRLLLVLLGFPEPQINRVFPVPGRRRPYRADLFYEDLKVVVEYDGDGHRTDPVRYEADKGKDDFLHGIGWRVIRVLKSHIQDVEFLVHRLRDVGVPQDQATAQARILAIREVQQAARGGGA